MEKNTLFKYSGQLVCLPHLYIYLPLFTLFSYSIRTRTALGKKKKNLCVLLTSKQVYKLIQRAVILKIFYV